MKKNLTVIIHRKSVKGSKLTGRVALFLLDGGNIPLMKQINPLLGEFSQETLRCLIDSFLPFGSRRWNFLILRNFSLAPAIALSLLYEDRSHELEQQAVLVLVVPSIFFDAP
jgi:hypothetical protein